jgi:hypothetical protein
MYLCCLAGTDRGSVSNGLQGANTVTTWCSTLRSGQHHSTWSTAGSLHHCVHMCMARLSYRQSIISSRIGMSSYRRCVIDSSKRKPATSCNMIATIGTWSLQLENGLGFTSFITPSHRFRWPGGVNSDLCSMDHSRFLNAWAQQHTNCSCPWRPSYMTFSTLVCSRSTMVRRPTVKMSYHPSVMARLAWSRPRSRGVVWHMAGKKCCCTGLDRLRQT